MAADVNAPETREEVMPDRGLAPLDEILCTDELWRRPHRPPDYESESKALGKLADALARSPRTILQTLADTLLEVFKADSAGMSLLIDDGKNLHWEGKNFYWAAIAGAWNPLMGGGTPRGFGP